MKVERIERYNEDYSTYVDVRSLIKTVFYDIDEFLLFIKSNHEGIFESFLKEIEQSFDSVISNTNTDIFHDYEKSIELDFLHNYPEFIRKLRLVTEISFNLKNSDVYVEKEKHNLKAFDRFRGRKAPLYLVLQSLTKVVSKGKAIDIYKESVEANIPPPRKEPYMNKVDEMLDLYRDSFPNTHIYSLFKIEEGKVGCRIDRCMIVEALKDFDKNFDLDIAFLTSCYNDYIHARVVNTNFLLTREKTIMEEDEYCDFIWHDKSNLKSVIHPEKEFWDNLKLDLSIQK